VVLVAFASVLYGLVVCESSHCILTNAPDWYKAFYNML